jgi:hypothetical protein
MHTRPCASTTLRRDSKEPVSRGSTCTDCSLCVVVAIPDYCSCVFLLQEVAKRGLELLPEQLASSEEF